MTTNDFDNLVELVDQIIGVKLCTFMTFDPVTRLASRTHTNMPKAYPVAGTKPIEDNAWTRQVLDNGEVFVANDLESIAKVFPDAELISSLGCASVINLPVKHNQQVMGTLNCLHEANHYTDFRIALAVKLDEPLHDFYQAHVHSASKPNS